MATTQIKIAAAWALIVALALTGGVVWVVSSNEYAPSQSAAVQPPPAAPMPVDLARDFPRLSPFSAIRWSGTSPEVQINGEWYGLISMDGRPVEQIVAYCQSAYENLWQKRFGEDLVAVLTAMGNPPGSTMKLDVRSLDGSNRVTVLENVPLTEENRKLIQRANDAARPSSR